MSFDSLRSAFLFSGVLRTAIHQFKYRGISSLAPALGTLLADYLSMNPMPADLIVPVPLHRDRRRERGYDQAELLARSLSRLIGVPVGDQWVLRSRATPPQARAASAAERRRNMRGAFVAGPGLETGRSVLLIDDVCTTGATMESCALALRRGGVEVIHALVVARGA